MGIKKVKVKIKETSATIISEEEFIKTAIEEVIFQRAILEDYISKDPNFLYTLEPYTVPENAPLIVKRMAKAGIKAGVGPMASVAGAVADFAVRAMLRKGAKHAIFENGGDISMFINKAVNVGIYSGQEKGMILRIKPRVSIIGICTSSGKMGHSLSFGKADSATVISEDPILADAVATAVCNSVKEKNPQKIENAINNFLIAGIEGIIVVFEELIGFGGEIPEISFTSIPAEFITI